MMNKWNQSPEIISGSTVDLFALQPAHYPDILKAADDKRIWEHISFGISRENHVKTFGFLLEEREQGRQFSFVIFHKASKSIIGASRLMDIVPQHRKLEIGGTWLHPQYWGCEVNFECKLLLLSYCFEELQANRVQLKTDENNIRSRTAIQKIGGKFEGVMRRDMIRDNGLPRNSAYFSIIKEEWPELKPVLRAKYEERRGASNTN